VAPEISNGVVSRLGLGRVQDHRSHARGVYEVKLRGSPWMATGTETMQARELLLIMLEVLEEHGWTVYASVDQKNGGEKTTETDTVRLRLFPLPDPLTYCSGIAAGRKGGREAHRYIIVECRILMATTMIFADERLR
jgi:hypothetical protein